MESISNSRRPSKETKSTAASDETHAHILTITVISASNLFKLRENEDSNKRKPKTKKATGKLQPDRGKVSLNTAVSIAVPDDGSTELINKHVKDVPEELAKIKKAPIDLPKEEHTILSPIAHDSQYPTYNYQTEYRIQNKQLFLDTLCSSDLKVRVMQCFGPKEKEKNDKSGLTEEKTELLGEVVLPLSSFLEGELLLDQWLPLHVSESTLQAAAEFMAEENSPDGLTEDTEIGQCEAKLRDSPSLVHVTVSLDRPLVTAAEVAESAVCKVEITSLNSLPKLWSDGIVFGDMSSQSGHHPGTSILHVKER